MSGPETSASEGDKAEDDAKSSNMTPYYRGLLFYATNGYIMQHYIIGALSGSEDMNHVWGWVRRRAVHSFTLLLFLTFDIDLL